jgi:hypothetical protein
MLTEHSSSLCRILSELFISYAGSTKIWTNRDTTDLFIYFTSNKHSPFSRTIAFLLSVFSPAHLPRHRIEYHAGEYVQVVQHIFNTIFDILKQRTDRKAPFEQLILCRFISGHSYVLLAFYFKDVID